MFISSTFRDMHAERDHPVKVVFPALREPLEKHRVHLVDVDLRWGVTKEQADNDRVLDLCLKQIDACRPFFLGILGQRYGWVPKRLPADALTNHGWVQHHTGKSVTELEILYGVLSNPGMRSSAFFYFRDPAYLSDVPELLRSVMYREVDAEAFAKLEDLKGRIRASDLPLFDGYPARLGRIRLRPPQPRPWPAGRSGSVRGSGTGPTLAGHSAPARPVGCCRGRAGRARRQAYELTAEHGMADLAARIRPILDGVRSMLS